LAVASSMACARQSAVQEAEGRPQPSQRRLGTGSLGEPERAADADEHPRRTAQLGNVGPRELLAATAAVPMVGLLDDFARVHS